MDCEGQHSWGNLRGSFGPVAAAKKARQREKSVRSPVLILLADPAARVTRTIHLTPALSIPEGVWSLYILATRTTHAGKLGAGGLVGPSFHPKCFILFLFMAAFKETTTAGGTYMVVCTYRTGFSPISWKVNNICTSTFWFCRRTMPS